MEARPLKERFAAPASGRRTPLLYHKNAQAVNARARRRAAKKGFTNRADMV
jgi:hypothetical protein